MRTLIITLFTLTILVFPSVSLAVDPGGIVPCNGPDCQACHVVQLGQRILTWFIAVMAAVIALIFVIGGLKMVMAAGNEGDVTSARSMMINAIIGFIVLLASWLIVDTVMKNFVKEDFLLGPWNEITCEKPPELIEREPEGSSVEGGIPAKIPFRTNILKTSMDSVSMTQIFGGELMTEGVSYYMHSISVDRSGFSMPIRVPDNLSGNWGMKIYLLDQNGQYINNNFGEISGSRTIGSEVISKAFINSYSWAKVILTPADAGRVIYYNFMPVGLPVPTYVKMAIDFVPYEG